MWSHLCFKILTLSPPRLQTEEKRGLKPLVWRPRSGIHRQEHPDPLGILASGGQAQSSHGAGCPQRHSRDILPWVPTARTEEVWVCVAPLGCTSGVGHSSTTVPIQFQTEFLSETMALSPQLCDTSHRNVTGSMHMRVHSSGYEIPREGISGPYLVIRQAKSHQTQGMTPKARGPTLPLSWSHQSLLPGCMALCWGGSLLQGPKGKAGYQGPSAWSGCKKLLSTQWGFSPSGLLILQGPRMLGVGGVVGRCEDRKASRWACPGQNHPQPKKTVQEMLPVMERVILDRRTFLLCSQLLQNPRKASNGLLVLRNLPPFASARGLRANSLAIQHPEDEAEFSSLNTTSQVPQSSWGAGSNTLYIRVGKIASEWLK